MSSTPQSDGDQRFFLLAFRNGMDAIEGTVVSAAEIPLGILSGIGVKDEMTEAARDLNKQLAHGIHGTIDTIVTQITDAVSKETSLVAGAMSGAAEAMASKS